MPHHDGDSGEDGDGEIDEIRRVQPYQATKTYLCPGCQQEIPPGLGHLVVVPHGAPEDRRHWHHACWEHRHDRRPGRQPSRR